MYNQVLCKVIQYQHCVVVTDLKQNIRGIMNEHDQRSYTNVVDTPGK